MQKISFGDKFRKNFEIRCKVHNIIYKTGKYDENLHKNELDGKIKI